MSDNPLSENPYWVALRTAYERIETLKQTERQIAIEKAQLRETVDALYPLVFPDTVDINSLSLPNAIRLVIRSAGRPLSASDFFTKLTDIGFDLKKYDNPLANIHTAMTRMCESDEMQWVEMEGKKKAIPGPELKRVPAASGFNSLAGILNEDDPLGPTLRGILPEIEGEKEKK